MFIFLEWIQVAVVIGILGALIGAGLAQIAVHFAKDSLGNIEPEQRFWLLSTLVFFPILFGLGFLTVAFLPSILDMTGLYTDHCAQHGGHAFHLCFLHNSPPKLSLFWSVGIGVFLVWPMWKWSREFSAIIGAHMWSRRLMRLARYDDEYDSYMVETNRLFAVTTGLFRQRIVLSDRIEELLSCEQFTAVLAHERAHAQRFDGLTTLLLRLIASFHLPGVRARLIGAIDVACEQICDEAAARQIDDRLAVAEAILAVERASDRRSVPVGFPRFGAQCIEKRVVGLLRSDWERPNWARITMLCSGLLVLAALNFHDLHHLLEHSVAHLF